MVDTLPPSERIEIELVRQIASLDWLSTDIPEMTTRHARFRNADEDEWPCTSIEWVGDEVREASEQDQYLTQDEMEIRASYNIIIDMALDSEDSGQDPSGHRMTRRAAFFILKGLKDTDSPLWNWISGVHYRSMAPDEEATSDESRLRVEIDVIYRVLARDPSVLLAEGVNA